MFYYDVLILFSYSSIAIGFAIYKLHRLINNSWLLRYHSAIQLFDLNSWDRECDNHFRNLYGCISNSYLVIRCAHWNDTPELLEKTIWRHLEVKKCKNASPGGLQRHVDPNCSWLDRSLCSLARKTESLRQKRWTNLKLV